MASTDAFPVPRKNAAYRVTFPVLDADGDKVTSGTGMDSTISKDGGTFAACTNEATEIATTSGIYYLDLTSTEMNADTVSVSVHLTNAGAKDTVIVMYPEEIGDYRVNVSQLGGTTVTGRDIGASVLLSSGTGTGQLDFTSGVVNANLAQILGTALTETAGQIAAAFKKFFDKATPTGTINSIPDAVAGATGGLFIAGTNAATTITTGLTTTFTGNLSGNVTGSVGSVTGLTASNLDTTVSSRLAPTVAGRTLDVSTGGEAGLDWANVGTTGSTVALSATTLGTVTTVTNLTEDVQSAVWDVDATGHQTQGTFGQVVGDSTSTAKSIWGVTNAIPDSGALTTLQADTDNIQTRLPAALESGRMASALDATGVDAILDDPIEGSMTLRQAMRIVLAACANKLSGAATTTVTIRDLADTKARITATVDADGNRSAVTLDAT